MKPLITATDSSVDFYSVDRLPLEPAGLMLAGREELRAALNRLQPKPGHRLDACLTTLCSGGGFDVENVLFYNVGNARFRRCTREGMSFRIRKNRPEDGRQFNYHHRYEMVSADTSVIEPQLVFHLDALDPQTRPHAVWWRARQGVRRHLPEQIDKFSLSVSLQAPRTRHGISDIVKPLLDGIIASFHFQPRGMDPLAESWLAAKLGAGGEQIVRTLSDETGAPLGARKVVFAYRDNVKWNPADDLCVDCSIRWQPSADHKIQVAAAIVPAI